MGKDVTEALKILADFAVTYEVDRAVNERRDQELQDKAYTTLNNQLPVIAAVNGIDPNQMAALNNISGSNNIIAGVDTFTKSIKQEVGSKSKLAPEQYNRELAAQVAPYMKMVDSIKGPDKAVAYQRLIDGVADAQSTYLKNNQTYKINEVKNLSYANISNLIESSYNKPEGLQVGTFDEGMNMMTQMWADKGMSPNDIIGLTTDVFTGIISGGDEKAMNLLRQSDYIKVVDRNKLVNAIGVGTKKIEEAIRIDKVPTTFTPEEQRKLIVKRYGEWLRKNPNKQPSDFSNENVDWLLKFGPEAISEFAIGNPSDYVLTGNAANDAEVNRKRANFMNIVAPMVQKRGSQAVVNKLVGESNNMAGAIYRLENGGDPFNGIHLQTIDNRLKAAGIPDPQKSREELLEKVGTRLGELQKNYGDDSWFNKAKIMGADAFGINLEATSPNIQNAYTQMNFLANALDKYMLRNKNADLTGEDWVNSFISDTFAFDTIGDSTVVTIKPHLARSLGMKVTPMFQEGNDSRKESQNIINYTGKEIFSKELIKSYDKTFGDVDVFGNSMIKIERSVDNSTLDIRLRRDPGLGSGWEDYNITSMFRLEFDPETNEPEFKLLSREEGAKALTDPATFNKYDSMGYRPTKNGAIPLTVDDYRNLKIWYNYKNDERLKEMNKAAELMMTGGF